ncbi:GNAT family N-acetyltransferase [Candidatus Woesearchaeota archaeon]|nr:GNAT family N-acetyltransferase [Candidatus Woesearchaeota archaeon]
MDLLYQLESDMNPERAMHLSDLVKRYSASDRGAQQVEAEHRLMKGVHLKYKHLFYVFANNKETLVGSGFLIRGSPPTFEFDGKSDSFLYHVCIDPKYQEHNIEATILGIIIGVAKTAIYGLKRIRTLAAPDFEKAMEIYQKFGFEKKGDIEVAGYKFHQLELLL